MLLPCIPWIAECVQVGKHAGQSGTLFFLNHAEKKYECVQENNRMIMNNTLIFFLKLVSKEKLTVE